MFKAEVFSSQVRGFSRCVVFLRLFFNHTTSQDMESIILNKKAGHCDIRPLINHFSAVRDGMYRVEVYQCRNYRSNAQNSWLWGCIYPILLNAMVAEGWENMTTSEDVHEFFKSLLCGKKIVNRTTGEVVTIPNSTARMDTSQFSEYCERLRDYGREYLGVEIPDPI